ncbi:hypothetical protein DQ812_23475 [Salmonella enterica subsp. enterica]|nr:hypothetical protein [Salmonella enterica subsp. enterica serovar Goverdhan]
MRPAASSVRCSLCNFLSCSSAERMSLFRYKTVASCNLALYQSGLAEIIFL